MPLRLDLDGVGGNFRLCRAHVLLWRPAIPKEWCGTAGKGETQELTPRNVYKGTYKGKDLCFV